MANLEAELKRTGLSDKEAKVYLAILELGEAPVQKISQKSKVNRATTYVILESLIRKEMVGEMEKNGKTVFAAKDPEVLIKIFTKEEKELKERRSDFEKLIPELKAVFNLAPRKPIIRFFEGKEGLKDIQADILKEKNSEINEFYSTDDVIRVFSQKELSDLLAKRIERKIRAKSFYASSRGQIKAPELTELKFMPAEQYPLHVDIVIYGEKIGLVSLKEPLMGVIIENKELALAFRSIFKMLWDKN